MATKRHMSLSVRGVLTNWNDKDLCGVFTYDDGREMSSREAKVFLLEELAKGRLKIPCGDLCEGYSYQTGCPGHEVPNAVGQAATEQPSGMSG